MANTNILDASLAKSWSAIALRGLIALLFGVIVFTWPSLTLLALVLLFGSYALVDGIFAIIAAIQAGRQRRRGWPMLLEGIIGIAVGTLTFFWPGITALTLLYFIAAWAIVTGIFEIVAAIELRKEIESEWLLALGGIASVLFGLLLVVFPGTGALAIVWLIGAYSLLFGILLLALAFRLYRLHSARPREAPAKTTATP
jgi:uncharacterized membrane protein HdeD (DUF308 family)